MVEPVPTAFLHARQIHDPDLILVGAHAHASFAPTLLGSFTEGLVRSTPADLLIVRG